jgi:hypothetical protein
MLWSVVETIMNIQPELKKTYHISMNLPMVHTNVVGFLVQVEYSRRALQQTIAYIVPLEGSY